MNILVILQCSHLNEAKNFRRGPDSIKMSGDDVLTLCDDCMAMVRGEVLQEIMSDALKQVFQATVANEVK